MNMNRDHFFYYLITKDSKLIDFIRRSSKSTLNSSKHLVLSQIFSCFLNDINFEIDLKIVLHDKINAKKQQTSIRFRNHLVNLFFVYLMKDHFPFVISFSFQFFKIHTNEYRPLISLR